MTGRDSTALVMRMAKIAMTAAIALWMSLVAFGNVTDYGANFAFVQHVMSMDSPFPDRAITYRAITSPALHHAAYDLITTEIIVAVLCWLGALALFRVVRAPARSFNRAKGLAIAGLALGFLLHQVGFVTIGGEWFGMWMIEHWNGVPSAFRFLMIIVAVLIFVALPDSDSENVGTSP